MNSLHLLRTIQSIAENKRVETKDMGGHHVCPRKFAIGIQCENPNQSNLIILPDSSLPTCLSLIAFLSPFSSWNHLKSYLPGEPNPNHTFFSVKNAFRNSKLLLKKSLPTLFTTPLILRISGSWAVSDIPTSVFPVRIQYQLIEFATHSHLCWIPFFIIFNLHPPFPSLLERRV